MKVKNGELRPVIIRVDVLAKYKDIPGVEEWRQELEIDFNSKESMGLLEAGFLMLVGAAHMKEE